MKEKLQKFAELLEKDTIERLQKSGLGCEANILNARTRIKAGKKYTKIDQGSSGRYMVDQDGKIYGIKAYGKIHKGHYYGTLDTIDQYYWGEYYGFKKKGE